ncbi:MULTISPECIES: DUF2380 domain-containing protein [Methylomonas]|uniref:DUF2380 domain-containing protein n=1 Tax=Methylomonas TaxID=416 RepID=UPI001232E337|nr:DUF2380 domain-containing protein [Methylomonas rhizoryzae]
MRKGYGLLTVIWLFSSTVWAAPRIAVLEFELKDLTPTPNIPAELARTASIKPLLQHALLATGYPIVEIAFASQQTANAGSGYLLDHADAAADLGKRFGADYVLIGRLHKPSFLFAYLMVHLVETETSSLVGRYIIESKGRDQALLANAARRLADKIDKTISAAK